MLFEILPAIVYQLAGPGLTELPVELIATILRYLDPEALLNVVRAYKTCKEVCLGDPILRRRLKTLLKQKKKLELEKVLDPKLGVTVTRKEGGTGMFGRNVVKEVKVNRIAVSSERAKDISNEIFNKPKKMMHSKRFTESNRYVPYRL